jgi:hypothetical protein
LRGQLAGYRFSDAIGAACHKGDLASPVMVHCAPAIELRPDITNSASAAPIS